MKKYVWLIAVFMLLCMTQAIAENELTPPVDPQASSTPSPTAATSDEECLHIRQYATSDLLTRCVYDNSSHHIIIAYYEVECFDCHQYFREVIMSETAEQHHYVKSGEHCDVDSYQHTIWYRCTGCNHVTETTTFCRGIHTVEPTKLPDNDDEDR